MRPLRPLALGILGLLTACGGGADKGEGPPALSCTPTTCAALGVRCGAFPDGCGGELDCGDCNACVPTSCAELGAVCGAPSDGCGGQLACGGCPDDHVCEGGGFCRPAGLPEGCRFLASELSGPPGARAGIGLGIDGAGTALVGALFSPPRQGEPVPFLLGGAQAPRELGTPAGFARRAAAAISRDGKVAGALHSEGDDDLRQGFIWSAGTDYLLPTLHGHASAEATALNGRGIVVGFSEGSGLTAVWWSDSRPTALPTLGTGLFAQAFGINDFGLIVGCAYPTPGTAPWDPPHHAVAWRAGMIEDLAPHSCALRVNDAGQILVRSLGGEAHFVLGPDRVARPLAPVCAGGGADVRDLSGAGDVLGTSSCWAPGTPTGLEQRATLWWRGREPIDLARAIDWGGLAPARELRAEAFGHDGRILVAESYGRVFVLRPTAGCNP